MTRQDIPAGLLTDIENYLNITWSDPATDEKVRGMIGSGMAYLNTKLGADISDILNKKNRGKGVKITITEEDKLLIECNIIVTYGSAVVSVAKAVQDNVTAAVESMTGITPAEINVNICGITVEQK